MDSLTQKWLQGAESSGPDNPAGFIDSVGGLEKYGEGLVEVYRRSGNRLFLLELFNVFAVQGSGNTPSQVPVWLLNEFAQGFGRYLQEVIKDPGAASLEECLGITKDMKSATANGYLSKGAMVRQVHRLRYHFRINVDQACYIVYEANRERLAPLTGADSPTESFKVESFLDHYHRVGAQDYYTWEDEASQRGEYPSKERRDAILHVLGPDLAEKVRKAAKRPL